MIEFVVLIIQIKLGICYRENFHAVWFQPEMQFTLSAMGLHFFSFYFVYVLSCHGDQFPTEHHQITRTMERKQSVVFREGSWSFRFVCVSLGIYTLHSWKYTVPCCSIALSELKMVDLQWKAKRFYWGVRYTYPSLPTLFLLKI